MGSAFVCKRKAPVDHGRGLVEGESLAEGTLGFGVPEGVKRSDALAEELLGLGGLGCDGEVGGSKGRQE